MKHRAVIIDDEKLAIEELKYLLKDYPDIEVVAEALTPEAAIEQVNTLNPDLIFLDIQLRKANAFDLLDQFHTQAHIIFATAYDEYAIRAFEINALDYLLKPIHPDRLKVSLTRFIRNQPAEKIGNRRYAYSDKIIVTVRDGYQMVKISDIRAITADGDYSYLLTGALKKHILIKSLKDWETLLPEGHFIRIHRSTIVNTEYIKHIEKWFSNTCRIYLEGIDSPFEMSQRYTASFKKNYQP